MGDTIRILTSVVSPHNRRSRAAYPPFLLYSTRGIILSEERHLNDGPTTTRTLEQTDTVRARESFVLGHILNVLLGCRDVSPTWPHSNACVLYLWSVIQGCG